MVKTRNLSRRKRGFFPNFYRMIGSVSCLSGAFLLGTITLPQAKAQDAPELSCSGTRLASESIPNSDSATRLPLGVAEIVREEAELHVVEGRHVIVKTHHPIYRSQTADSGKLEIMQMSPRELSIVGTHEGSTTVTMWTEEDDRPVTLLVRVLPESNTELHRKREKASSTAAQPVVLRLKICELDRVALRQLTALSSGSSDGSLMKTVLSGATNIRATFDTADVELAVHDLAASGAMKILAQPRLMTTNGQLASLQINSDPMAPANSEPGKTHNSTATVGSVSIKVELLPIVMDDDRVQVQIAPAFTAPHGSVTFARSSVELQPGQTYVMSGFVAKAVLDNRMGHVPVRGAMLSETRSTRNNKELFILVTSEIGGACEGKEAIKLTGHEVGTKASTNAPVIAGAPIASPQSNGQSMNRAAPLDSSMASPSTGQNAQLAAPRRNGGVLGGGFLPHGKPVPITGSSSRLSGRSMNRGAAGDEMPQGMTAVHSGAPMEQPIPTQSMSRSPYIRPRGMATPANSDVVRQDLSKPLTGPLLNIQQASGIEATEESPNGTNSIIRR